MSSQTYCQSAELTGHCVLGHRAEHSEGQPSYDSCDESCWEQLEDEMQELPGSRVLLYY